jgi:hypothetical protein
LLRELKKINLILILVAAPIVLFMSSAFAQSTVSQESKTKTTESDKKKKATKNTNQSVAQGLSIAESMLLNESPWGFFFNATATRGLDEYADTWSSINELSVSYRINSASALGFGLGYETLIYEKGGALFNNTDKDPERFGITDFEVSYTRPKVWSDKYNRLVWSAGVALPTSRASQRNSLITEASTSLALRYQPNSKVIITPSVGTYYRQFRLETANVMGLQANSPFGTFAGLAGSYVFNRYLIGSVSYSQTLRYDFFEDWRTVQSASARLIVNATDTLNVSLGYRWRDDTVTNEPLFDDDRSIYIIGVGYVF